MKSKSKNNKKLISIVAGTRPNFVKVAPLVRAFLKHLEDFDVSFVHTGQHYDKLLSDAFLEDLSLPKPDAFLGVGSGSHIFQLSEIMKKLEDCWINKKPDLIIVVGDVNSTLAAALAAKKMDIPLAHVESGLRSFDETMPEETNRRLTDQISDLLFVTEQSGIDNLLKEGISRDKIYFVGNIMIDSLIHGMPKIKKSDVLKRVSVSKNRFGVMTLHRPSNVDNVETLKEALSSIKPFLGSFKIVFPVHPRTRENLKKALDNPFKNLLIIDPLGYIDFMKLVKESAFVFTDSGGLQEETTFLGIPCLTMRENTERPITVRIGTSILVNRNKTLIEKQYRKIMSDKYRKGSIPRFWDGKTSDRMVNIIKKYLCCR